MAEPRTYNNNSRNADSTNSQGRQYYNSDGLIQSTLELNFWNKMISLRISPALEQSKRTQTEKFDYNAGITTAVATEKARLFAGLLLNEVVPNLEAGTTMDAKGVPIGLDSSLIAGVKEHEGEVYAYLGILKKINPDNLVPEDMQLYQFNKVMYLEKYDYESGSLETGFNSTAEIIDFAKLLLNAADNLIGATAHSVKHNDRFFRNKLLGGGGGADKAPYSTNNVFGNGNSYGGGSNKSADNEPPVDKTSLRNASSLSDFTDM